MPPPHPFGDRDKKGEGIGEEGAIANDIYHNNIVVLSLIRHGGCFVPRSPPIRGYGAGVPRQPPFSLPGEGGRGGSRDAVRAEPKPSSSL
jgi:hypothetical protein